MSVKGSLESLCVEDLLRADLQLQGAGTLTLRHGPHYAALYLDADGVYVLQPDLMVPDLLLEAFAQRGLLDAGALAAARRRHLDGIRLLDDLVASGALPEADYLEVLAAEVEDTILDMMLWDGGSFSFEPGPLAETDRGLLARICVDPIGVAERSRSRLDTRRLMAHALGRHGILFRPLPGDLPPRRDENDPLHDVYMRLDGHTVVHEIALALGRSRFAVLEAVQRLVAARCAARPTAKDLLQAVQAHADAGQTAVARRIVLQWVDMAPDEPAPLLRLASLASQVDDRQAQIEALCSLGHLHLRLGDRTAALDAFTRALKQAPADDVIMAGLQLAAEGPVDDDAVNAALLASQSRLDEGDVTGALQIIDPLLRSHPQNVALHLLRARALLQSQRREEFCEQAEAVGRVLETAGCRSQTERDAVAFFRQNITQVAPDRGDLLERFRAIHDPRRQRMRARALAAALVLLLAGVGVTLWPSSAADLLEKARAAASSGDLEAATDLIARIVAEHEDAPEADEALALQRRLFPPPPKSAPASTQDVQALRAELDVVVGRCAQELTQLPSRAVREGIAKQLDRLDVPQARPLRSALMAPLAEPAGVLAQRLLGEVMGRVKVLGSTAEAQQQFAGDPEGMRALLDKATAMRDATWIEEVAGTAKLLARIAGGLDAADLRGVASQLAVATEGLAQAGAFHDRHVASLQVACAALEIEDADRRCREDAPALLVRGQLDEADALYADLQALLQRYAADPLYAGLMEGVERRQLPALIRERRKQIDDIRRALAAGRQAEEAGRIDEAVRIYAELAKDHWMIRFENVVSLPLQVESVPTGARVLQDGRELGRTPLIVRYPWGSEAELALEAPGYATARHTIAATQEEPPSRVTLKLRSAPVWSARVADRHYLGALAAGDHALLIDRRGRLRLLDGATGRVRWAKDHGSLEGVRGRPAMGRGVVYVPHVDGLLRVVDVENGALQASLEVGRVRLDGATNGGRAAFVSDTGRFVVVSGSEIETSAELGVSPTAGLLHAHGAFWLGTLEGRVVRVTPDGRHGAHDLGHAGDEVLALTADEQGVYATTSGGALVALDPAGSIRWRRDGLGDLLGGAARVGSHVAALDRSGHVSLLAAEDGTRGAQVDCGSRPLDGLVAVGSTIVLARSDGSLWAFDVASGEVVLAGEEPTGVRLPLEVLPGGRILVPLGSDAVGLIPAPRRPR